MSPRGNPDNTYGVIQSDDDAGYMSAMTIIILGLLFWVYSVYATINYEVGVVKLNSGVQDRYFHPCPSISSRSDQIGINPIHPPRQGLLDYAHQFIILYP